MSTTRAIKGKTVKITYLIHNVYGIGGTIRTVLNQAGAMATLGHDVEIASVFRHRAEPALAVPSHVRVVPLVDRRAHTTDPRAQRASALYPVEEKLHGQHSELSDAMVADHLAQRAPDVVVGTRAGLNILLCRLGRVDSAIVGQEHLTYSMYAPRLLTAMARDYRRLDALTPVTDADAESYRTRMRLPGVRVTAIPNCVPQPPLCSEGPDRHTILAAGRVTGMKGYDLLLDAFHQVCGDHPDWTLRIFGRGQGVQSRKRQITALGLHDRAFMMGPHPRIEEIWPLGSFCAVTSRDEPFGMSIVEAMRAGLPVVATDCPHGPAEIINDGTDGLLVPSCDTTAIANGLDRMMGDDTLRATMAAAALTASQRYSPEAVARRHEILFQELAQSTPTQRTTNQPPAVAVRTPTSARVSPNPQFDRARCTVAVDGDGSAHITVATAIEQLLLRGSRGEHHVPVDDNGMASVAAGDLPTGTTQWEVLGRDGSAEQPLRPELIDLRYAPGSADDSNRLRLVEPYRDAEGLLRLTARRFDHYAEAGDVAVAAEGMCVTGTILGTTTPDHDAALVLRARGAERAEEELPCGVAASGRFTVTVATPVPTRLASEIIGRTGGNSNGAVVWDLWLRCHGREHPIGRCLLGIGPWKRIISYPGTVHTVGRTQIRMHPFFTNGGHLALATVPVADAVEHASATTVEEAAMRLADGGRRLEVAGLVRSVRAENNELALRAVTRTGAAVPVPVHTEYGPRGVSFTGAIGLTRTAGGQRLPYGRWRLVLTVGSGERATEVELSTPSPFQALRWWRGLRPVYSKILPGRGGERSVSSGDGMRPAVVEHRPVRVAEAVRKRLR